jgi:hypothetical protein
MKEEEMVLEEQQAAASDCNLSVNLKEEMVLGEQTEPD